VEIIWNSSRPATPREGDVYFDDNTGCSYIYVNSRWIILGTSTVVPLPSFCAPTPEQLEKHPSLKEAWDEFMVIKKLLGV
jgi:hypothetical protein